ncbi:MAG: pitrilysin family protein [Pseudomonadota bacterium]
MRTLTHIAAMTALLATPAAALDIQSHTTPGGIGYWLVEEPAIPMVALEITFEGGARLDPAGQEGAANYVAALLDEGAGDLDAVGFAEARDAISARFGFSAGRDSFSVSARMLSESANETAALLATALAEPRFDADPMARVRGQILSSLAEAKTNPSTLARDAWFARAFAEGHPYASPVAGSEESVEALTREALLAAHGRLLTRANVTVGVVGDVDAATASALIDTVLAGLPEGEPVPPAPVAEAPPAGVQVVELSVPQSAAIFGHAGLRRDDPDFFPAFVMNYILGGGDFSSRLMEEVREKRGLAYGVYSYLSVLDGAALHLGSVQTVNARMAESLDVIRGEWARLRDEGIDEDALERAKRYLTGAFALRFDSNAKIAGYLVFMQREDLGIDYYERRNSLVEAVTVEDVNRVAAKLLDPDALSIVVVGQPVGL